MKNCWYFRVLLLPLILSTGSGQVSAQVTVSPVHKKAIVIDTHTDTPMNLVDGFNPSVRHADGRSKIDFPRLREGNADAVFFAIFTGQRERTPANYVADYELANRMIDSTLAAVRRSYGLVEMAYSADDIVRIAKKDKTAICMGMENGFPLAKDLSRVEEFYKKGIRYITLCHSANNDICDSSTDPKGPENNGLSEFGKQVVAEMNRLGIMIDVSHISDKSFYDVIASSKTPVIASHSSVRSLCNHPRNMTDDMIKALAAGGGVIQICILGAYIAAEDTTSENYFRHQELKKKYHNGQYKDEAERQAAWKEWNEIEEKYPPKLPTIAQAVDHIDYVVKLVGIDHVGIGSDFDGGGGLADCTDAADYPKITEELIKRGYSHKDINKIWGGNFLRVFREVESYSRRKLIPNS